MKEITFNCPACDFPLTVPASAASDSGPCPECGEEITGPGLNPEDLPEEEEAPAPTESEPKAEPESDEGFDDPVPLAQNEALPEPSESPKPSEARPDPIPAAAPRRGMGMGAVLALCILSALTGIGIGYQLGRSAPQAPVPQSSAPDEPATKAPANPPITPDPTPPAPTPTPPAPTPPAPTPPAPPIEPEVPPVVAEDNSPRKAAVIAFLSAPDWKSRTDLVLHPDHVRAQMESLATTRGDGPVAFTKIKTLHETAETAVFRVTTEGHPNGFPIALNLIGDRWLVDWSGFSEFHYDLFRAFMTDSKASSGTFRLLIKPELAELGDIDRQPYAASTPDKSKPTILYVAEDSEVHDSLDDMIGALASRAPASFRNLMEEGGIPLILRVKKSSSNDTTSLVIDRIVAQGWSPIPPETP